MISQSIIVKLEEGDTVWVELHRGAIKGGGETTFTSFLGIKVADINHNEI